MTTTTGAIQTKFEPREQSTQDENSMPSQNLLESAMGQVDSVSMIEGNDPGSDRSNNPSGNFGSQDQAGDVGEKGCEGDTFLREQDRFLPIANVSRIMKKAVPQVGKVPNHDSNVFIATFSHIFN
eukprot:sb/3475690/